MQDQFPHHGRPRRRGLVLDREAPVRSLGEGVGRADLRSHCLCHRLLHLGRVQLSVREPVHLNKVGAGREVKERGVEKTGKEQWGQRERDRPDRIVRAAISLQSTWRQDRVACARVCGRMAPEYACGKKREKKVPKNHVEVVDNCCRAPRPARGRRPMAAQARPLGRRGTASPALPGSRAGGQAPCREPMKDGGDDRAAQARMAARGVGARRSGERKRGCWVPPQTES